jgi:hypothetical protein
MLNNNRISLGSLGDSDIKLLYMMKLVIAFLVPALLMACNEDSKKINEVSGTDTTDSIKNSGNTNDKEARTADQILPAYFLIKNALVNDDGKEAASAASDFIDDLDKINKASIADSARKNFDEILDDAKEMAEHIEKNGKDIKHQRYHFEMLSDDIYDMLKLSRSSQTLYRDFCPMYNNNKGAGWISETKEINNPYLGKKMPACGEIKEVLKQAE